MNNLRKILITTFALSILISCSNDPTNSGNENQGGENTTGKLEVTITTTGENIDNDGYDLALGDSKTKSVEANATTTFDEVEEGAYALALSGVAQNCTVSGENPVSVQITAKRTSSADFSINCETATEPATVGIIAFTKVVDQNMELFTINPDGSNEQRLTNNDIQDSDADISPDGTKIVYMKQGPTLGNFAIWVMNIDGTNKTQLTSYDDNDRFPSWSPDGTQIVFESDRDGDFNIYKIASDGTGITQITSDADQDQRPDWSPEGSKIMFTSSRDGEGASDIYTINTDGTGVSKLLDADSNSGRNLFDPVWSPDASKIAYQGYGDGGSVRIFVADADGTNPQMISAEGYNSAYHPAWSPDGNYLAFTDLANGETHNAVWIMNTDGSGAYQLTSSQAPSSIPGWGIKN